MRAPLKLAGLRFSDLFAWLSSSLSNLSRSHVNRRPPPPPGGRALMPASPWRVAMASSIGQSHVAAAQPCQDAHFHLQATDADGRPVMVLAAADGAGSAALAEVGASLACETFGRLVEAYVGRAAGWRRSSGNWSSAGSPAWSTGSSCTPGRRDGAGLFVHPAGGGGGDERGVRADRRRRDGHLRRRRRAGGTSSGRRRASSPTPPTS